MVNALALYHNPDFFEHLPNARLRPNTRDVLDILCARQEPGGVVRITQAELAERLRMTQSMVSHAINQLKDKGIINPRTRRGLYQIHPLLAGYESEIHMVNALRDPTTEFWTLRFPGNGMRPPRPTDPRAGTVFDPDPDGGEPQPLPDASPPRHLYLAAS